MIISSITIINFRQFYKENTIQFATDHVHNLTVIHGLNGAGKTALLNAFSWALYGIHKLPPDEPDYNTKAYAELDVNDKINVQVIIRFNHDKRDYELIRSKEFQKTNAGARECFKDTLIELTATDISGRNTVIDNPKDRIWQIIPQEMQPYFFFDGEDINRLGDTQNPDYARKIKQAIKGLMELTIIERAIEHLGKVERKFRNNVGGSGNSTTREITDHIETVDKKIIELDSIIQNDKDETICLQQSIKAISDRLRAIEPVRHLEEKRLSLQAEWDRKCNELKDSEKSCIRKMQTEGALAFLPEAADVVAKIIENKREKGVLPSGIREAFINDILERGVCICNRHFEKKDDAYEAIRTLLARQAGTAEIEDTVNRLSGFLSVLNEDCEELKSFFDSFIQKRGTLNDFFIKTGEQLSEITAEIEKIAPKDGSESPAALEEKKRSLEHELSEKQKEIVRCECGRENAVRAKSKLEEDLKKAVENDEKCRLLIKRKELVKHVGNALSVLKDILTNRVKDGVSSEIQRILGIVTDHYLYGKVTSDFELKTYKSDNGQYTPIAASSGQQQVTSLAFIASLIKIASDNMQKKSNIFMRGGEFPMVMDAPFNNVDVKYGPGIAKALSEITPQVILMTNPAQWEGAIENVMRAFVGKEYMIIKFMNNVQNATTITLPTGTFPLVKQTDGIQFSMIQEAK